MNRGPSSRSGTPHNIRGVSPGQNSQSVRQRGKTKLAINGDESTLDAHVTEVDSIFKLSPRHWDISPPGTTDPKVDVGPLVHLT